MANEFITYRDGYKYQLDSDYLIKCKIIPSKIEDIQFIKLDLEGNLTVRSGYAWDGPSGPVVDTKENLRASLVHDALYQLMRNESISAKDYKDDADVLFKDICIEDGVSEIIAKVYYLGLKLAGEPSTNPRNKKKIKKAPNV